MLPGAWNSAVLERLGVSREADFYLCGPTAFLRDFTAGLAAWGVAPERVHTEIFGPGKPSTPGIVEAPSRSPHPPAWCAGTGAARIFRQERHRRLLGPGVQEPA